MAGCHLETLHFGNPVKSDYSEKVLPFIPLFEVLCRLFVLVVFSIVQRPKMTLFGALRSVGRLSTPLLTRQRAAAFATSARLEKKLKVAVIGQSLFGLEVYKELMKNGHKVVGVFTVPDINGKPDPLGAESEKDGVPTFKFKAWRSKATGGVIPSVMDKYQSLGAELNVLPFCSQFIPMDVINKPEHKSIIYHPSILPRHRGASAINW